MKRRVAAAAFAIIALSATPARAWDPFAEDDPSEPSGSVPATDPAPFIAPPLDIYYVTDTYVADVVTSSGPVTTYSTSTVHESTGSYARVLETVATGDASAFDRMSFNGRRALADGRLVAGTYYENYVLTDGAFIPISIVFFQDDAEIARITATTPGPGASVPVPSGGSTTTRPLAPGCCAAERPVATIPSPTRPPSKPIRPGISLLPASPPLAMLEVLRGRPVSFYLRAVVDDHEVPVRSWTVIGGDPGEAVAASGSGAEPFRTAWPRLAPAGAAYAVAFRIEVDTPETGHRFADVAISVLVRSPALER
jgi:uncharacterized membrane protein (UPF0127 family)